ncbi:DUF928 domain-containing protein [bacterium]|nr:MAG: DUF928 domain-containing protein [bacterium]
MKTIFRPALFASPLLFLTALAQADDIGIVIFAEKEIRLQAPGQEKKQKIGIFEGLKENSRVQIGENGRAVVVLYQGGQRFSLSAGSIVTVTVDGVKEGNGIAAKKLTALKPQFTEALRVAGADEKAFEPPAVPFGTIANPRPTFKWIPVPNADAYMFRLTDDTGKTIIERESTMTSLTFPAEIPELKPGVRYSWTNTTSVGDDNFKQEGTLELLSLEKRAALAVEIGALQDDNDADKVALFGFLRGETYRKYGLFDEAMVNYQHLLEKNPDSPELHESIAQVMALQNMRAASEFHRKEADRLRAE